LLFGIYLGSSSASKIEGRITRDIDSALSTNGYSDWAKADVDGQKVRLTGQAPSARLKDAAINAVMTASGAGGVFRGGVTKVIDKMEIAPLVSPYVWSATRKGGLVTLSGHAPDRESLKAIVSTASEKFGEGVIDEMSLASGVPEHDGWIDMVRLGLGQLEGLESGKAVLKDRDLLITGQARSPENISDIDDALMSVSHPFTAEADVTGPYHWSASHNGDVLVLDGYIPDEEARRSLLQVARNAFDGEVLDKMKIGPRNGWVAIAEIGLGHIAKFNSGSIKLIGDTFLMTGDAPESAYAYLTEDVASLPAPFAAQIDVNIIAPAMQEIDGIDLDVVGDEKEEACQKAFLRVMSSNRIFFATARADIDRKSGETLDKLVEVARRCSEMSIVVEGHSDNRGSRPLNLELSQRRADAVRDYFIAKGMQADQMTSIGYGPDRPADSNDTPEGRANNRRIEFKVVGEEDE
tara:strand:+ start:4170 stop:5564 length:1395 start_codon:yes stop_codon:yes gene_type:complete